MSTDTPIEAPVIDAPATEPDQDYQSFKAGMKAGTSDPTPPAADPAAPPAAGDPPPEPPAPPKRPWQNTLPPERQQILFERQQRELEDVRRQLEALRPSAPAPGTAAPPEGPREPQQEDFVKDGVFDSNGYMKAFGAWTRAETLREFQAQQAQERQQEAAKNEEQEARTAVQTFEARVQELAAVDPDIAAGIAHFRQNYGAHVPGVVARSLIGPGSDPRVMYAIACSEDLTRQMAAGDPAQSLKIIGIIEDRIAAHDKAQKSTPPAPPAQIPAAGAYVPRGGAPAAPVTPRTESGQFAPRPPAPTDYGAANGGGSDPLFSSDYDTFKSKRKQM
jgi:hypothetical protein